MGSVLSSSNVSTSSCSSMTSDFGMSLVLLAVVILVSCSLCLFITCGETLLVLGFIFLGVAFALDSFAVLVVEAGVLGASNGALPISAAEITSSTTVSVSSVTLLSFSGTYCGASGTFRPPLPTFFSDAEEAPFFIIPDLRWRLELLLIGILLEDLALDILVMAENSDSSDVKSSS